MKPLEQAKRPATVAAGPYGHPVHPIMVTVPIGAWVSSLVFDIGSHAVDDPGYLFRGSEWLIVIGLVGAVLAALFGAMDLLRIPRGTPAFVTGVTHMALNLTVVVAYLANVLWRHNSYDHTGSVPAGPLALSVVSLVALSVSGFLGGKLAYRYGVRVADEATQAEGFRSRG